MHWLCGLLPGQLPPSQFFYVKAPLKVVMAWDVDRLETD